MNLKLLKQVRLKSLVFKSFISFAMKNLLIVFLLAALAGCSTRNSEYKLSKQQETDFISIMSALRKIDFNGSIVIVHREIRNSSAETIKLTLPDSIFELSVKNEISSLVVETEFIYFVMDGFKGVNYGLVFSSLSKDRLDGFYDVRFIRRWNSSHYWYFASSKFY